MNVENPTSAGAVPESTNDRDSSAFGKDVSVKRFKDLLIYLFVLGLIVRTGFLVEHLRSPSFGVVTLDQKYYDTAARMILAGEDLHQLRGLRPLLYPMFLAVWYKVGGAHGIDVAVVVQHILGSLTGVLVALLGARLFRHRLSGLAGGVLYLLAPVPLYFEGELLVESSYTFLICLTLLLMLRTIGMTGWRGGLLWLSCGALTVLTAQARANILIFMAAYPLLAAWHWWRARQPAALLSLWALIGGAAMGSAWGFINEMQSDHFQAIPSAGGVNLYLGNKRTADGMVVELNRRVNYSERYEDSVEVWARQEYEGDLRAHGRKPESNPMAISKYWTHRAIDEIRAAPFAWLHLMAKKTWLTLWNAEVPNNKAFAFLQTEYVWLRLLPVRWVVLLLFAPAGIWAAAKWGNRDALFVLLFYAVIYSAANIAFFICDRYRYPVWPVMAAIAGGGLLAFVQSICQQRWRAAVCLSASMALMAAISLPNWFDARLPTFARDYLFRSVACYEKGHFREALKDVDQSLALDPEDVTAMHHRGNVLLALYDYDGARKEYERTSKINAEDSGVWNNLGVALDKLGRTDEAAQAFRRAMQCDAPSKNAFIGLAFEQLRAGRLADAAATLDQLDKLENEPNAAKLIIRSVIARRSGDAAKADALETQARHFDSAAAEWALKNAAGTGQGAASAVTPAQ